MHKFTHIFISFNKKNLALACLFLLVTTGILVHKFFLNVEVNQRDDIYYLWLEGKRLLSGENPYARVLSGNMRENNKYATYFPLFYLLSYLTQFLGLKNYPDWLSLWRNIFLIFNLGIALTIFYTLYEYGLILLAFFSALFWLFNRWTLHVTTIAHIDFIPLLFLILSLLIFRRFKWLSLFIFSLSLSVKQIGIFLVPLYLIWIWQSESGNKVKTVLLAFAVIISIPLLTSLPFIAWNSEGFFKSILFSATRNPGSHFDAPSLDAYIKNNLPGFVGIKAKIPMLF